MEKYMPELKKSALFEGLSEDDIRALCGCMGARVRQYAAGECLLRAGDSNGCVMLVVRGSLLIQCDDYWGKRSIINMLGEGELFGEAYAARGGELLNDVVAAEDCAVVSFDLNRLLHTCNGACAFHSAVIRNLFFIVCEKNRALVRKLGINSQRSTRDKLTAYLSDEAKRQGSSHFTIPFKRQELADYLCVDRSAMSSELGRMRDEGLLSFNKSSFELHEI